MILLFTAHMTQLIFEPNSNKSFKNYLIVRSDFSVHITSNFTILDGIISSWQYGALHLKIWTLE